MIKIWPDTKVKDIHTALAIVTELMRDKCPVEPGGTLFFIHDLETEARILRITTFNIPVNYKDTFCMELQDCLKENYKVTNEYKPESGENEETLLITGV